MFEPSILESDEDEDVVEENLGRKARIKQSQLKAKTKQPVTKKSAEKSEPVPAAARTSQRGKKNVEETASKSAETKTKQQATKQSLEKSELVPAATRTSRRGKKNVEDTTSKADETKTKQKATPRSSEKSEPVPVVATRTSRRGRKDVEDTVSKSEEPETSRTRSSKSKEVATGQEKRRANQNQETVAEASSATEKLEVAAGTARRTRQGKVEDYFSSKESSSSAQKTVTDAAPTRKKEPIEDTPQTASRRISKRSKTTGEQDQKSPESEKLTTGNKGKMEEQGKVGGLTLRLRKTGKKAGGSFPYSGAEWETAGRPQAKVDTQGGAEDSDETASLSSTASSIKDLAEEEVEARPTRSSRRGRAAQRDVTEADGPQLSAGTRSRRRQTQEKMDSQEETAGGRRSRWQKNDTSPSGNVSIEDKKQNTSGGGKGPLGKEEDAEKSIPATSTRRSRKTLSESHEKSPEIEKEVNVRKSSRRAATDSQGNEEQEKPKTDGEATFAVPKPVTRTSRSMRQRDLSPQEADSGGTETSRMGGRSASKASETPTKVDVSHEKETEQSNRRGRKPASLDNQTPAKQESPQSDGVASRKRGRSSAVPEVIVTEAKGQRESRSTRHKKDVEDESIEVSRTIDQFPRIFKFSAYLFNKGCYCQPESLPEVCPT